MASYTKADQQTINRERIDTLTPHPRNARQGDIGAIAVSLEQHGQYRPIVAQTSTRHVIAGNHTMRAATSLGWTHINTVWLDVDDDEAVRIMLVDNRTNDLAGYDIAALSDILEELTATPDGLDGTGFDADALTELIGDLSAFAPLEEDNLTRLDQRDPTECPKCGYTWRIGPGNTVEDA